MKKQTVIKKLKARSYTSIYLRESRTMRGEDIVYVFKKIFIEPQLLLSIYVYIFPEITLYSKKKK